MAVVLPDVVATLSPGEKVQDPPSQSQSQDKIFLEKLEEENLRLKAIFKLHSIKLREDGERRSSSDISSETSSDRPESKVYTVHGGTIHYHSLGGFSFYSKDRPT